MTGLPPGPSSNGSSRLNGSGEGHTLPRTRRARVEVPVAPVTGDPTPDEERAIAQALELLAAEEQAATTTSPWKMVSRAWATRSGALDYRTRLGRDLWPVTSRLPWSGRIYDGRGGRGDSK